MSVFINADTLEYPRHEGDVALDPDANWLPVEATPMPEYAPGQMPYEVEPIQIDGVWTQQWKVRDLTTDEIERDKQLRIETLNRLQIPKEDIERLLSSGE